jgi:hypothetical protein
MRLQCNHDRLRRLPVRAVIFSLVVMGVYAARVDADPTVHFELRLAPGQDDAVMTLGDPADDTLQIELWGEVSDAAPGTKVRWHGVFPRVSQDGVISYAGDYAASVFTFGCLFPASDNTPSSGDFSATCIDALGIFDGVGAPALWGTFSVSAVAVGQVSYDFAPQVVVDQQVTEWGVTLDVGTLIMPELINLFDSDCGDGSCNVTGSVDPALAVIEVVDMPQVARSPDADEDGDVDFQDYSALQACVIDSNGPLSPACQRLDLDSDNTIGAGDAAMFAAAVTGILPPIGGLDEDQDVDLADFARYQLCRGPNGVVGNETLCTFADVDRNGTLDEADLAKLVEQLTGPAH